MENEELKETQLTDDQINTITEDLDNFIKGTPLEDIANMPSNNGVEESSSDETGEYKLMNTVINPETGEHAIVGEAPESTSSFDDIVNMINTNDTSNILADKPVTEEELVDYLANDSNDSDINKISDGIDMSPDTVREILKLVNRRLSGEKFNIYKESPDEVKKMIDDYIAMMGQGLAINANARNRVRKEIGEAIFDEFAQNIKMDRAKHDFAIELANLYETTGKELEDANLEFIEDRNKLYREAAEEIEDDNKKQRMLEILDQIDEARNLTQLKEFATRCKIKKFDMEKPEKRIYSYFLNKYRNSSNNIYDINLARTILSRNLEPFGYTTRDCDLFLICFCKQVSLYNVNNACEHAYMYYVLYYSVMLDSDKSEIFRNNVKEVIDNIKRRNNI